MINNLFTTRIGSHAWGMEHSGSDIDLFRVYVVSTKDLLCGTANTRSVFRKFENKDGVKIDCHSHEVSTLIHQLLKGNVNFVIGAMSPWVEESVDLVGLLSLRQITTENVGKSIYPSVKGLAINIYYKYVTTGKVDSSKKCNTILRMIEFAIRYLDTGKFSFEAVRNGTPEDIQEGLRRLDEAYEKSSLVASPVAKPFENWLYGVRLSDWKLK